MGALEHVPKHCSDACIPFIVDIGSRNGSTIYCGGEFRGLRLLPIWLQTVCELDVGPLEKLLAS